MSTAVLKIRAENPQNIHRRQWGKMLCALMPGSINNVQLHCKAKAVTANLAGTWTTRRRSKPSTSEEQIFTQSATKPHAWFMSWWRKAKGLQPDDGLPLEQRATNYFLLTAQQLFHVTFLSMAKMENTIYKTSTKHNYRTTCMNSSCWPHKLMWRATFCSGALSLTYMCF